MKKIMYWFFMPAIITLLLAGCKKNEQPEQAAQQLPRNQPYKIENGRVVFESIPAYRAFMDNLTDAKKKELADYVARQSSYTPLNKSSRLEALRQKARLLPTGNEELDDDLEDVYASDFLGSMINSDGIVQMGDYLFNIDMVNNMCYALHKYWLTTDSSQIIYGYFYNGDFKNNYVFEFSTEDDVLDYLEAWGYPKTKDEIAASPQWPFCTERHANPGLDKTTEYFDIPYNFYRVHCKARYLKLGIYFSLYGKIMQQYNGCLNSRTEGFECAWLRGFWRQNTITYAWRFKPRCWGERVQPLKVETIGTDNARVLRAWESSRGLHKYDYSIQWKVNGIMAVDHFHNTRIYRVRYGY
jgi:hypothetical protein